MQWYGWVYSEERLISSKLAMGEEIVSATPDRCYALGRMKWRMVYNG
jgi:hypothetical protein